MRSILIPATKTFSQLITAKPQPPPSSGAFYQNHLSVNGSVGWKCGNIIFIRISLHLDSPPKVLLLGTHKTVNSRDFAASFLCDIYIKPCETSRCLRETFSTLKQCLHHGKSTHNDFGGFTESINVQKRREQKKKTNKLFQLLQWDQLGNRLKFLLFVFTKVSKKEERDDFNCTSATIIVVNRGLAWVGWGS